MKKLTPEKPAFGISQQKGWPDAKFYKVPCECGCNSEIDFMIEVDDYNIQTTFCSTTKTNYWRERLEIDYTGNWWVMNVKLFINDMYNRFAIAWNAIVHGYIQTESCVMLNPQQAINFAEALKVSVEEYEVLVAARMARHEANKKEK